MLLIPMLLIALVGCQTTAGLQKAPKMMYTDSGDQTMGGSVRGEVRDPNIDEPLIGATVKLYKSDEVIAGAYTDFDGKFQLENIEQGTYDLTVEYVGYTTKYLSDIVVQAGKILFLDSDLLLIEDNIELLKPMIYLYPEKDMEVEVNLKYEGKLTHTYPKSEGNWKVKAAPDGTLTDENGRNYYGLFWEGTPDKRIQPKSGCIVARDSLVPFLESSLDQLGLNFKEANEFIVFWLPVLEQSPYNLIYFAESDYTDMAALDVDPTPDQVIRVMMGYVPLKKPVEIQRQVLPEKLNREGFVVVEWGGTKCCLVDM